MIFSIEICSLLKQFWVLDLFAFLVKFWLFKPFIIVSLSFPFVLLVLKLLQKSVLQTQNRNTIFFIQLEELCLETHSSDPHEHYPWWNCRTTVAKVFSRLDLEII